KTRSMVRPLPAPLVDPFVGFTVSVMNSSSESLVMFALVFWSVLLVMVSATTDGGAPGPRASPHPGRVVCGLSGGYDVRLRRGLRMVSRRAQSALLNHRRQRRVLLHAEQGDLVLEVVGGAERLVDAREPQVGERVERPQRAEGPQRDR